MTTTDHFSASIRRANDAAHRREEAKGDREEKNRARKKAGRGLLKSPGLIIKKTAYGASVRVTVAGRQYQSALYDQRKGFSGGQGSVAHPVASESMFMRSETYGSRSSGGQKLKNGGTSKKRSTAGAVVSEVLRDLENTHHLDQQAILDNPHIVHHGDPAAFRAALSDLQGDLGKTSEHYLAGFVFSLPKVSLVKESNAEIWPAYRDDCIAFMKNRYPGRPLLIVEHCDEKTNFHIHALVLNNPGERMDQWYEPRKATATAVSGFTERVVQAKIKEGLFTGSEAEQRAAAKTWANGALKHGFLQVQKQDDGTEKKVRVYDTALTKEMTALKKAAFTAAASGMQDDFHAQVASKYGKTRFGPRRQRLSAAEMQAQKAVQSLISRAIDAQRDELLKSAREMEAARAVSQKLNKTVAQQHGERKLGKRKLKQQRQAAKAETKSHRAEVRALSAEQAALAQAIAGMGTQRDALAEELKGLSEALTKKSQQAERVRDRVAELLKKGRNFAGQVRQQKAILKSLEGSVVALESDRLAKSEALDGLDAELRSKRQDLAKAKSDLTTTATELKAAIAEVAQNEEYRVALVTDNEALETKGKKLREDIVVTQAQRDDLERDIAQGRFVLDHLNSARQVLFGSLCGLQTLRASQELLLSDVATKGNTLAAIESKIVAAEATQAQLQQDAEQMEEALSKLTQTVRLVLGEQPTAQGLGKVIKQADSITKMIKAAESVETIEDIQRDAQLKAANLERELNAAVAFGDPRKQAEIKRDQAALQLETQRRVALVQSVGLDIVSRYALDFGSRHEFRDLVEKVVKSAHAAQVQVQEVDKLRQSLAVQTKKTEALIPLAAAFKSAHAAEVKTVGKEVLNIISEHYKGKATGTVDQVVEQRLDGHPVLAKYDQPTRKTLLKLAVQEARSALEATGKKTIRPHEVQGKGGKTEFIHIQPPRPL